MFFTRRATQAEYFDSPERSPAELAGFHSALARINRFFVFADPFQRLLPKLLGHEACRSLSFLDVGAGDGSLGTTLAGWAAARRGWNWRFTHLDVNLAALRLGGRGSKVAGSALALPFQDATFDVVVASQMTHHFATDADVCRHLREAWRVARRAIFLSDLRRGPILYGLLWLTLRLGGYPKPFREDGLLSVRRGFRADELQALALQSGVEGGRVRPYYGTRVLLQARKC